MNVIDSKLIIFRRTDGSTCQRCQVGAADAGSPWSGAECTQSEDLMAASG